MLQWTQSRWLIVDAEACTSPWPMPSFHAGAWCTRLVARRGSGIQRVTTGHCGTADRSVTSASKMGPIQQRKSQVKRDLVHISRSGSEMVSACMDGPSGEEPLRGWLLQDYESLLRVQDPTSNSMLSMCVIQDHVSKFELWTNKVVSCCISKLAFFYFSTMQQM